MTRSTSMIRMSVTLMITMLMVEALWASTFHVADGTVYIQDGDCSQPRQTSKEKKANEQFQLDAGSLYAKQTAEIGYQNRLGQVVYAKLKGCRSIENFSGEKGRSVGLLAIVEELLSGDKSVSQGGKRLKAGTRSLLGMPTGDVLKPSRELSLDLAALSRANVRRVQLVHLGSSTSLVDRVNPKGAIWVSGKKLTYGTSYRWIVDVREDGKDVRYQDVFRILERVDQQDFESEIRDVMSTSNAGAVGKHMMRAAIMDAYGLIYDRNRMLKKVRKMQKGR